MSGASTMRNAIKRVTHKERSGDSQHKKKFKLLEKHKDYVIRANDYKKKQLKITSLRKKAKDRNPDEFYFKMNNSEVRDGIHINLKNKNSRNFTTSSSTSKSTGTVGTGTVVDADMLYLLKSQDLGYITLKKSVEDHKINKLKENLHIIGEVKPKTHKIFVSDKEELESFDTAKHFETIPELVGRSYNRLKVPVKVDSETAAAPNIALVEQLMKEGNGKKTPKGYRELHERIKRSSKLTIAMHELMLQRHLTNSKGSKRKIVLNSGDDNNTSSNSSNDKKKEVVVFKWKRERLR